MIDGNNAPAYDESPAEDDPWLTTSEVMGLLNVSRQTLLNWRKKGRLRAYRVGLRSILYKQSELAELISLVNSVKRI